MQPLTKLVNGVEKPLFVLRRIDDKFVINPRWLSNTAEGEPNPGDGLEALPIYTETPVDFDGRLNIRTQFEGENIETHRWEIVYKVTPRSDEEKKEVARNIKRMKVAEHLPAQDKDELIVALLMVVLRDAKGLSLTEGERAMKEQLADMAAKLKSNDDNLKDIEAAIDEKRAPDLDAGWEAPSVK